MGFTHQKAAGFTLLPAVFLILIIVLSGCSSKEDQVWLNYLKDKDKLLDSAANTCNSHGQIYLTHYYDGLKWEIICYQASPVRFFYYGID